MSALTVYDPPMCCSTGICGPEVDQRLVDFAADLDWLKARGATVRRVNLSQEPMEFVTQPAVKALMDATGGDDLPAILIGGRIVSQGRYPSRAELSTMAAIGSADAEAGMEMPAQCCGGGAKPAPVVAAATAGCCGGGAKADAERQAGKGACC